MTGCPLLDSEYAARQNGKRLPCERLADENAKLRDELDFCLKYAPNCDECAAMLDCDECLRADSSQKERKRLDYENARLREQIFWLKQGDILHVLTDQEYIDQCERERLMQVSIDALDKENAKLRELVAEIYEDQCDNSERWRYRDRMRELGIEVG